MTVPGSDASRGHDASGYIVLQDEPWVLLRFPSSESPAPGEPAHDRLVWVDLARTPHTFHDDLRPEREGDP